MTRRPERSSPWPWIAWSLIGVVALWHVTSLPTGSQEPVNSPSSAPSIAQPQPTIQVRVVMEYPTATATNTPRPTMVPTSTPIPLNAVYPACGPDLPGGTTCRPERPATTPTPYPVCQDGFYPALCVVPGDADAMSARSETE